MEINQLEELDKNFGKYYAFNAFRGTDKEHFIFYEIPSNSGIDFSNVDLITEVIDIPIPEDKATIKDALDYIGIFFSNSFMKPVKYLGFNDGNVRLLVKKLVQREEANEMKLRIVFPKEHGELSSDEKLKFIEDNLGDNYKLKEVFLKRKYEWFVIVYK